MNINDIINLIAHRDNISILEATNLVSECQEELWRVACKGNYQECEDIFASWLGLEPDYLDILLPF